MSDGNSFKEPSDAIKTVKGREATMGQGNGPAHNPDKYNTTMGGAQKIDPKGWTGRKSAESTEP